MRSVGWHLSFLFGGIGSGVAITWMRMVNDIDTAKIIQVIETTILRRGNGTTTPIRIITQYWSLDGRLLWEIDPHEEKIEVVRGEE